MKTYKEFSISLQELAGKESFISRQTSDMTRKNIEDQKRIENRKREMKPLGDDLKTSKPSALQNQEVNSDSDPVSRSANIKGNVDNNYQGKDVKKQHQLYKGTALKDQRVEPKTAAKDMKEEKEANAENCSDLPANEKKKERQMDIEKINKKIKPHHKKIVAKK